MGVVHHPGCTADYPEKGPEPPQHITREQLEDGFYVDTCVDCGAFETNLPPTGDPYWNEVRNAPE